MDQVVADGVAPVDARVFGRVALIEEVPSALPEAESVGVVQVVLGIDVVVEGSMGVVSFRPASMRSCAGGAGFL